MRKKRKRILIFGVSPLPIEKDEISFGPGLRTWHLTKPLVEDRYDVCLVTSRTKGSYANKHLPPSMVNKEHGFIWYSLEEREFEKLKNLQKIHDRVNPDCIVVVGSILVRYCVGKLKTKKPIWIDLFGNVLIEAQAKANLLNNNEVLLQAYKSEKEALLKGDVFSVISRSQKFATIGELGLLGRLGKETFGYEFVYEIPCGIEPLKVKKTHEGVLRDKLVKRDDFIVLWNAGYNTWCDVKTLFNGLELAMDRNSKIKFVSIGGPIYGHDEDTYKLFCNLIEKSKHKDNYFMLDWIDIAKVSFYYSEADVGINIDRSCYEAQMGSRNRILSGLSSGLPFLSTNICELTNELEKENILFTFKEGDSKGLSNLLLKLSKEPGVIKRTRRNAQKIINEKYSFRQTTDQMRRWIEHPYFAPDKAGFPKRKSWHMDTRIFEEYIKSLKLKMKLLESDRSSKDRQLQNYDKLRKDKDGLEKAMLDLRNYTDTLRREVRDSDDRNRKLMKETKDISEENRRVTKELKAAELI